jgi:CRISPR/Cas system-associated endoribonuclease Cas2
MAVMAYFVVTYDLRKKKKEEYKNLWDELGRLDAQHYQESCWFVDTGMTTVQLRDLLRAHTEKEDAIMVVEFSKKPAGKKSLPGTKPWLKARFG